MPFQIAVASSDGENIDLHFGQTSSFLILTVSESGETIRSVTRILDCETSAANDESQSVAADSCGGGGCGHGGCGGGAARASPRILKAAEAFSDCEFLLAAGVGPGAERALANLGVLAFQISGKIEDAVKKIHSYKQRITKLKRSNPS